MVVGAIYVHAQCCESGVCEICLYVGCRGCVWRV